MRAQRLFIAIVDDEESVRRALSRLLKTSNYRVITFASGYELLERVGHERPDCVLLDLHLPGLSGLDLLIRLRAMQPPTPTIVITGHDAPGMKARVLDCGAHSYLLKPLDEAVLFAAIAAAVDGRESEENAS